MLINSTKLPSLNYQLRPVHSSQNINFKRWEHKPILTLTSNFLATSTTITVKIILLYVFRRKNKTFFKILINYIDRYSKKSNYKLVF